jgi:hypothetical protein
MTARTVRAGAPPSSRCHKNKKNGNAFRHSVAAPNGVDNKTK